MVIVKLLALLLVLPVAINAEELAQGVTYTHYRTLHQLPQSIHVITLDPQRVQISLGIAQEKCAGASKVSTLAAESGALIAINGGYFDFGKASRGQELWTKALDAVGYAHYHTFPVFILKQGEQWYATSNKLAGFVGWRANGEIYFGAAQNAITVTFAERIYPVSELNKPYARGAILYTPVYDIHTPKRKTPGCEIVVVDGTVKQVLTPSTGGTPIPGSGFVYWQPKLVAPVTVGQTASFQITTELAHTDLSSEFVLGLDTILGGTPLLIQAGAILPRILTTKSNFYCKRHPRTAVGVLANGHWVLLVADGRQPKAQGLTLLELAQFLQQLGCQAALNLDGGGSTTLVLRQKLMNRPVAHEYGFVRGEKPVSNALLVHPRWFVVAAPPKLLVAPALPC